MTLYQYVLANAAWQYAERLRLGESLEPESHSALASIEAALRYADEPGSDILPWQKLQLLEAYKILMDQAGPRSRVDRRYKLRGAGLFTVRV